MKIISTDDLRRLEVINLCGGERLGFPCELELDLDCGSIISFTVTREGCGFSLFGEREEYVIPWCKIECIGADTILVKLSAEDYYDRERDRKKRKSFW